MYYFLFLINKVWAAEGTIGRTYTLPNPLRLTNITDIIQEVAHYLTVYIAPPIVTIMILIAGFYFLTAGENPERVKTARQIILWTVIGYAIILISWGATSIIQELLGGAAATPPASTPLPPPPSSLPYQFTPIN